MTTRSRQWLLVSGIVLLLVAMAGLQIMRDFVPELEDADASSVNDDDSADDDDSAADDDDSAGK